MSNLPYKNYIDGLRAVAVLLVIIFHYFPNILPFGFVGVDVFFVISGYLISGIILTDLEQNKFSLKDFYFRRIRRIFPTLILVLLFCLIFGFFYLNAFEYKELAWHSFVTTFFSLNFQLLQEHGYFDAASELKPLLHLWSLAIEEQFYLLFPLLLLFCFRKKNNLFALIAGLIILSFCSNIALTFYYGFDAAFYLPFCRFFELLLGCQVFLMQRKKVVIACNYSWFAILIFAISATVNFDFPLINITLSTLACAMIIFAGGGIATKILSTKIARGIGLISYPLYLWHWPLLSLATIYKGRHPRLELLILLLVVTFVLAFASYKFFEIKIRKSPSQIGLIIAMIFICAISLLIVLNDGFENRISHKENMLVRTMMQRSELTDNQCLKKYAMLEADYCRISGANLDKKIFIIGDSHSQALFDRYSESEVAQDYQIIHLALSGCSFINSHDAKCRKNFTKIIEVVNQENPQFVIYVNDAWNYTHRDAFGENIAMIFDLLSARKIIYYTQIPRMPFTPSSCLQEEKRKCVFQSDVGEQYLQELTRLNKKYNNLTVIDISRNFCARGICNAIIDEKFVYYKDGKHLSKFGATMIPIYDLLMKKSAPINSAMQ